MRPRELVICGLKSVRSRFESHSETVKRLFFNRAMASAVGDLCSWMAQERLVYRCVESEELERIAGTVHHGGVVVVIEPPDLRSPRREEVSEWSRRGETLLLLDRINNVHNLGAIIRTAAYFGVTKLILPDHPQAAVPTEAAYRVAEGGLDHVEVFLVEQWLAFLREIRREYFVIGAATHGGDFGMAPPSPKPIALVLGNEEYGLAPEVEAACDHLVTIPGSRLVESLNVSTAAAILIWEITRPRLRASTDPRSSGGASNRRNWRNQP